ncbi:MAG: HypC/HybG/HupF family hydrogenase formation chaperone [bacterium JZ-2024 1]
MCLGIPGEVIEISPPDDKGIIMGKVNFGGIIREVCLSYVPEVQVGNYVIVHVGFAISIVDEEEAKFVWDYLNAIGGVEQELKASS